MALTFALLVLAGIAWRAWVESGGSRGEVSAYGGQEEIRRHEEGRQGLLTADGAGDVPAPLTLAAVLLVGLAATLAVIFSVAFILEGFR